MSDTTSTSAITVAITDSVATVTFDNPPANALSTAVIAELEGVVDALEAETSVRSVVFAAAGQRAFLSGADIKELPQRIADPEDLREHTARVGRVFERVAALPQPTVIAVQADAVGGGLEFALLGDFVVAASTVTMALPEVRLGLIPGAGGTQRLGRRIGTRRATEMVLLGGRLGADEALACGLVNRVCERSEVLTVATELAQELAALPRVAAQAAKAALRAGEQTSFEDGLRHEAEAFRRAAASVDAREGCLSFLERRQPQFTHQ